MDTDNVLAGEKKLLIDSLAKAMSELTAGQLQWLDRVVHVFSVWHDFKLIETTLLDETILQNFGDALRIHHSFSSEPFSKDKFEFALVKVFKLNGHQATLAPRGTAGYDATIDNIKFSLKTQADKGVKDNIIWISKFMELGKGTWGENPEDLVGLREQFVERLSTNRILTLRTLTKPSKESPNWKYELVEIPRNILGKAKDGELRMMKESKQFPKPGYCYVPDQQEAGKFLFKLYFDGGGERKLQIKDLNKKYCSVHATWEFFIPPEQ